MLITFVVEFAVTVGPLLPCTEIEFVVVPSYFQFEVANTASFEDR